MDNKTEKPGNGKLPLLILSMLMFVGTVGYSAGIGRADPNNALYISISSLLLIASAGFCFYKNIAQFIKDAMETQEK